VRFFKKGLELRVGNLCLVHEVRVEPVILRGVIFRAMRELGLFDEKPRPVGDTTVAPRSVLLNLLAENLPAGEPDVVLVRVAMTVAGKVTTVEIEDVHDGTYSALARTTAFPATALCDLILRGEVDFRGAAAMTAVAPVEPLLAELAATGVSVTRS
jgi:saccharopine dehydrogenase-like NADP-dependent oxidoreductase